ncbi:hypothetical protein F0U59_45340 [Archangium gephyra]|nr:hypothetical protein F0U59_45340 [Archangium gephyra]
MASRLAGPAIVRLSTASWRGGREWPDILGASVRFRRDTRLTEEASPGDQVDTKLGRVELPGWERFRVMENETGLALVPTWALTPS